MTCTYDDLSEREVRTLQYATTNGRGGKGTVFVFSAGNEHRHANAAPPLPARGLTWLGLT